MKTALAPTASKRRAIAAALQFYRPQEFPLARLEKFLPHVSADRMACELVHMGDRLNVALARTAAAFVAVEGWSPFGYMRLRDFTREVLDRSGRWLRDLAVLGRGLEAIPALERALLGQDSGAPIGRVVGTCIARVATADTVQLWLALARRSTVREFQDAVRTARQSQSTGPPIGPADLVDRASVDPDPVDPRRVDPDPVNSNNMDPSLVAPDPARRVLEDDEEEAVLCDVRFMVKRPVHAAFEETHDLHRAISGHQTSIASFVEALTGEASTGFAPPDVHVVPRVPEPRSNVARATEERLARATQLWQDLGPRPSVERVPSATNSADAHGMTDATRHVSIELRPNANGRTQGQQDHCNGNGNGNDNGQGIDHRTRTDEQPRSLTQRIAAALDQFDRVSQRAGQGGVAELARQLSDLVRMESEIERCLGRHLHEMRSRCDHASLGFASIGHYAEQRLGMSRRTAERRTGIHGALRHLPRVLAAYEKGELSLQASWLIRRIVGSKPVSSQLEQTWVDHGHEVSVKRMQHEVRAAGLRALGLLDSTGRDPRWPSTDLEWHASLWRAPGMTRGHLAELGQQALDPTSDNVFLRLRLPEETATAFLESVEGARQHMARKAQSLGDSDDATIPPSLLAAHGFVQRGQDVPAWVGLLAVLEDFVQTWDDPGHFKKHEYDEIYMRDGFRCMAPGCTSRRNLEAHHLVYRSHLGCNAACNLYTLCQGHHQRGEHGRLARCKGEAPLGVTWRLGQPELATWFRNERRIDPTLGARSQGRWWDQPVEVEPTRLEHRTTRGPKHLDHG